MKRFLVCFCIVSQAYTGWAAPESGQPDNAVVLAPAAKPGPQPDFSLHPMWVVDETSKPLTWVEIHQTDGYAEHGHLPRERLSHEEKFPFGLLWRCPHLAITKEALERSLIRPIKQRGFYPESFEQGYHDWQQDQKKGMAFVCTTTIADFVKTHRMPVSPTPRTSGSNPD